MKIEDLYPLYLEHRRISTDTRKIQDGDLFFALKGANFNGNQFAKNALEKGAAYSIIDEEEFQSDDDRIILVDDVLDTLQKLANYHRKQFDIPFVAVTGSNGKTTTKEILIEALKPKFKVHATAGNFNNHIGVPLTLLAMPDDTEVALIEMGDNHVGEVTELCKIAEPTHGFVTNIGKDHIEGFGSFEENIRAKSEIYHYLIQHNGIIYVNSQDEILRNMSKRMKEPIFYGGEYDFSYLELEDASPYAVYKNRQDESIHTHMIGVHNFENIQTAFAVGKHLGVDEKAMHKAISEFIPKNNRSELEETADNLLIMDAYNANPSSIEAAIISLEKFKTEKEGKTVILGDMFELGDISSEEHKNIIRLALEKGFQSFFVGPFFYEHQATFPDAKFFEKKENMISFLKEKPLKNQLILVKGSRGISLETLKEFL